MSEWSVLNLGDAMLAGEFLEHIKTLFLSEYEQEGNPDDMAVFVRHESEGRLHCEVMVYLSPAAASVAKRVDAIACHRPSSQGLSLLAGSEAAWTVFFPERGD